MRCYLLGLLSRLSSITVSSRSSHRPSPHPPSIRLPATLTGFYTRHFAIKSWSDEYSRAFTFGSYRPSRSPASKPPWLTPLRPYRPPSQTIQIPPHLSRNRFVWHNNPISNHTSPYFFKFGGETDNKTLQHCVCGDIWLVVACRFRTSAWSREGVISSTERGEHKVSYNQIITRDPIDHARTQMMAFLVKPDSPKNGYPQSTHRLKDPWYSHR